MNQKFKTFLVPLCLEKKTTEQHARHTFCFFFTMDFRYFRQVRHEKERAFSCLMLGKKSSWCAKFSAVTQSFVLFFNDGHFSKNTLYRTKKQNSWQLWNEYLRSKIYVGWQRNGLIPNLLVNVFLFKSRIIYRKIKSYAMS